MVLLLELVYLFIFHYTVITRLSQYQFFSNQAQVLQFEYSEIPSSFTKYLLS